MTLNFTIFVQAFNFFIVCLLLKHLLFKPAVKSLQQEQYATKKLEENIDAQQKIVDDTLEYKKETWKKYQLEFKKSCPEVITTQLFEFKEKKEIEPVQISVSEIKTLSDYIQKALVQRIEHVQ